jgi:hypothetical protein
VIYQQVANLRIPLSQVLQFGPAILTILIALTRAIRKLPLKSTPALPFRAEKRFMDFLNQVNHIPVDPLLDL